MGQRSAPAPRNAAATKEKILSAAVKHFAAHGYSATSLRDIAQRAAVSLPLVSRYFGSKAGLFEAALRSSLQTPFLRSERAAFGTTLVRLIADGGGEVNPSSIKYLSTGDPEARAISTRLIEELLIVPMAEWLGEPFARRRAEAITMLGAGLNTHVHLLPTTTLEQPINLSDPLLAWYAKAIQEIVDGSGDWAERRDCP